MRSSVATAISKYHKTSEKQHRNHESPLTSLQRVSVTLPLSRRYESQKRHDWNTFNEYLQNRHQTLTMSRVNDAHVLEFLRYLDQFGKTKVHAKTCAYFGNEHCHYPWACPLKQCGSASEHAAFEESVRNTRGKAVP